MTLWAECWHKLLDRHAAPVHVLVSVCQSVIDYYPLTASMVWWYIKQGEELGDPFSMVAVFLFSYCFYQERFLINIRNIILNCTTLSDVITLVGQKSTHLSDLELLNVLLNKTNQSVWGHTPVVCQSIKGHEIKEYLLSPNEIFGFKIPPAKILNLNWGSWWDPACWNVSFDETSITPLGFPCNSTVKHEKKMNR